MRELRPFSVRFAAVVLAHLKALQTRGEPASRQQEKLQLVKGLYQRNWTAEEVRQLFRLVDWMLELPTALQEQFRAHVHRYEEEKAGGKLLPKIRRVQEVSRLRTLTREIQKAKSLEEFRRHLR